MRVMQVMAGGAHGGAETYFTEAVCALQAAGTEQIAITQPDPHRLGVLRRPG